MDDNTQMAGVGAGAEGGREPARARDRAAAHVCHHLPPRRRQDHADREAAAVRRRHPARRPGQGQARRAQHALGLDGDRAGARHLGRHLGDDLRVRRRGVQPARHAGPRGLLRPHLSHAHGGRLRHHGDRRGARHRGAHAQAVRDLPAARHSRSSRSSTRWTARAAIRWSCSTRSSSTLALQTAPMVWPIGRGPRLQGHLRSAAAAHPPGRAGAGGHAGVGAGRSVDRRAAGQDAVAAWRDEIALVETACGKFDLAKFRDGTLTPVFFGSALKNFGVRDILEALIAHAPPPRSQKAATRTVEATEKAMTGVVFKIQANMDPNHRDRIAFMRVCSGKLTRGMRVKVVRTEQDHGAHRAAVLLRPGPLAGRGGLCRRRGGHSQPRRAQDRRRHDRGRGHYVSWASRASRRRSCAASGWRTPSAPRSCARRCARWPRRAWCSCSSRSTARQPIVGVIGALQLDVLADRLQHEYGLQTGFDPAPCDTVRWIESDDSGRAGALRREEPVVGRHRPRRRPGVPRHLGLQPVMDGRAQPRDPLRRHQDDDRIADFVAANS